MNFNQIKFALVMSAMLLVAGACMCHATQPACTGDRHYDSEANGCCPNVEEPTVCEPVLPCPDPAPCPTVECKCEAEACTPTTVNVSCPSCEAEVSEVCKVRRNGTVVCPRAKKPNKPGPRRIYVPRSIIEKIADDTRY